jgi:transposase-like protein
VRQGDFHPKLIPYRRRTSLELSEAILALYASGASTRDISGFLESVYGAFYSPQSISRLTQVVEEEVKEWKSRPLSQAYYAIYLDCTFLAVRRGKAAVEPVYVADTVEQAYEALEALERSWAQKYLKIVARWKEKS